MYARQMHRRAFFHCARLVIFCTVCAVGLSPALAATIQRFEVTGLADKLIALPDGTLLFADRQGSALSRYDPATGFTGTLQLDLTRTDGRVRAWTFDADGERARIRHGAAPDPVLTITTSVADAMRMAAGQLGAGRALLEGRVELQGSFRTAMRVGAIFGGAGS